LLISPFYSKGFGAEMGAGERAEFRAATQHSQNRQWAPILGIVLICIVFLSFYSLKSGIFWSDILTACICYISYQIYTRKQAPSMLRGVLSCLLQGAGKGYFGVT
jgi:hypothetical protein